MKATKCGTITVKLETSPKDDMLICKVIDTGRGIPADIADKVFLPFVKGDAWTPGAGLGLNITQELVNRMKGTVQLLPNPECGMTFLVELPMDLRTQNLEDKPVASSWIRQAIHRNMTLTEYTIAPSGRILKTLVRSDSNMSTSSGSNADSSIHGSEGLLVTPGVCAPGIAPLDSRIRVLVVDDNDIGRKLARRAIANSDVITKEANGGLQAFEIFKSFAPHLVLTDVGMPDCDGITASKMMRNYEAETHRYPARIYAVTGLGATDSRLAEDGLQGEARLDGWLTKGKHGFEDFRRIVNETSSALALRTRSQAGNGISTATTATNNDASVKDFVDPAQSRIPPS